MNIGKSCFNIAEPLSEGGVESVEDGATMSGVCSLDDIEVLIENATALSKSLTETANELVATLWMMKSKVLEIEADLKKFEQKWLAYKSKSSNVGGDINNSKRVLVDCGLTLLNIIRTKATASNG